MPQSMPGMKSIYSVTLLSAALVVVTSSCGGEKKGDINARPATPPMTVDAVVLAPSVLENKIQSTGTILAEEEVEIRSEVEGRILTINFVEGRHVRKGDLLIKLIDDDLQAELKKLLLQEDLASQDVFRKSKLLELDAISSEEYEQATNQLGVIRADIDLVEYKISQTEIRAPFSGVIGLRYVSPGGYVSSSTMVTTLLATDPVRIEFTVPEKYIRLLRDGTPVSFTVEGTDSTFTGVVYAIEPKVDPMTRTLTARAKSPNPQGLLYPGSFARLEIVLESIRDALVVPSQALIPDIQGEKLFIYGEGTSHALYVETGLRTEKNVEVTSGLAPGDTVITTGLLQLREGMTVNVKIDNE